MPCPDHMVSGHTIAEAIHHQPVTVKAWVRSQARPCGFYGGQSETMILFSPSTAVLSCQCNSTIVLYSFNHLPPTQYNIFLQALLFSPVSIIPPLFHTHSLSTTNAV